MLDSQVGGGVPVGPVVGVQLEGLGHRQGPCSTAWRSCRPRATSSARLGGCALIVPDGSVSSSRRPRSSAILPPAARPAGRTVRRPASQPRLRPGGVQRPPRPWRSRPDRGEFPLVLRTQHGGLAARGADRLLEQVCVLGRCRRLEPGVAGVVEWVVGVREALLGAARRARTCASQPESIPVR